MTEENHTPSEIEKLKSDAVDTRQRLADNVDALGKKVSPDNLKKEAKAAVTDLGRKAVSEVQSVAQEAATQTQKFSLSVAQVVRENPVPALMVGAGLGWLIYRAATRTKSSSSGHGSMHTGSSGTGKFSQFTKDAFSGARQKLQGATGEVKQHTWEAAAHVQKRAGELSEEALHQARDAGRWIEHSYQVSPLLFGAATIGAGLALGLALPRTKVENELIGEQRDNLVDQMKQSAENKIDQLKESAESKGREIGQSAASKAQNYAQKNNGDGSSGDSDRF